FVALSQLKLREAEQLCQQALELFRRLGSRYYEADALLGLTFAKLNTGEVLAARELVDQALRIEQDFGLSMNLWVHSASAYCDLNLGRYAEARSETRGLLDVARQRGLTEEIGTGLDLLGAIAAAQGDLEQAESYFRESIAVFKEARDVLRFRQQASLGYVARAQGDESLARKCLHDVLRAARDHDYPELALRWLPLAALFAADDDRPERSVELYSLARHIGYIKSGFWRDLAGRELDEVRAALRPEVAAAAEERGRALDVQETAEMLLFELSS
ncbi:MAG: hypothetical protein R3300_16915, partial [Candidatus Promineifilaceae bacterium]|nr:hypothetical protein [Candidatus Promineifilaceae bacterium]